MGWRGLYWPLLLSWGRFWDHQCFDWVFSSHSFSKRVSLQDFLMVAAWQGRDYQGEMLLIAIIFFCHRSVQNNVACYFSDLPCMGMGLIYFLTWKSLYMGLLNNCKLSRDILCLGLMSAFFSFFIISVWRTGLLLVHIHK